MFHEPMYPVDKSLFTNEFSTLMFKPLARNFTTMKQRLKLFFGFIGRFSLFCMLFSVVLVVVLKWLPVAWTPLMFFREIGDKIPEDTPIRHEWVNEADIAPSLQLAVVCTEDQRFLVHHGFDWESIKLAMEEAEKGGKSRGASTISQQTAKNVFCWPSSTFLRKGAEAWFTVLIEVFWSKERILEVYLNSIEFGPGVYGCEAAAQYFWKKHASELTNGQSARLAAVLPNPLKYNATATSGYVVRRQSFCLKAMANYGYDLQLTRVNGEVEEDEDDTNDTK